MPRVSVVIPSYNCADLISKTLDSVLAQTYQDFEVIVVDDGSTDDTQDVLQRYDEHIKIIQQTNQGEGGARNTGIRAAQGEYIAFVDSDDLWAPTKLERQIALFASEPEIGWVYSDAYYFESDTGRILYFSSQMYRQYEGWIAPKLLLVDFIPMPTPVIRRSIFEEVGMFPSTPWAVDWDMWLRVAARYPVGRVPDALAGHRIHERMMTQIHSPSFKHQHCVDAIERAVAFAPEVYGPVQRRALALQCIRTGRSLAGMRDTSQARKMFAQAVRHWPGKIQAYVFWLITLPGQRPWTHLAAFNHWWQRRFLGEWAG